MLYWLAELSHHFGRLQRLPLHHLPHRRRRRHRACSSCSSSARHHRLAAAEAGQGPADPRRRAAVAPRDQEGHADHGRADDPVGPAWSRPLLWANPEQRLCLDRAVRDARLRRHRLLRRLSQGHQADHKRLFRPLAARARVRASPCCRLFHDVRLASAGRRSATSLRVSRSSRTAVRRSSAGFFVAVRPPSSSSAPAMRSISPTGSTASPSCR